MMTPRRFISWTFVFLLGTAVGAGGVFALRERPTTSAEPAASPLPPRCAEATIFLPVVDNQAQPFAKERWRQALELLVAEFGGATLAAEMEGCWRNGHGELRCEPVRPVIITFESHRLKDLRRVLQEVGQLLEQEVVYARFDEPRILQLPIPTKTSQKEP